MIFCSSHMMCCNASCSYNCTRTGFLNPLKTWDFPPPCVYIYMSLQFQCAILHMLFTLSGCWSNHPCFGPIGHLQILPTPATTKVSSPHRPEFARASAAGRWDTPHRRTWGEMSWPPMAGRISQETKWKPQPPCVATELFGRSWYIILYMIYIYHVIYDIPWTIL